METDSVAVRALRGDDLDAVVRIDSVGAGQSRREFLGRRLEAALGDSGVRLAFGAELEGDLVGFLLAAVHFGEFGTPVPTAVLDVVGVRPDARGQNVGAALLRQMEMQLRALGIEEVRTEVGWEQLQLLGFFKSAGFEPAPRFCLHKRL